MSVRTRALLPGEFGWKKLSEQEGTVTMLCMCENAKPVAAQVTIDEAGSSIEIRCRECGRFVQLRASREEPSGFHEPIRAQKEE